MVDVFKTSVCERRDAEQLLAELNANFPGAEINFDLEDSDRILRIASASVIPVPEVAAILLRHGHSCETLND